MLPKQQNADVLIVYPDSNELDIMATQAELMRLGFYKGKVDGRCKHLTLKAEVRYLQALLRGQRFNTIWEGYKNEALYEDEAP